MKPISSGILLAPDLRLVDACRACDGTDMQDVLSLGDTPLANSLPSTADELVHSYSLDLIRCRACCLVQLRQIVSPQRLFSDYVYFSSFSDTMLRHADQLAEHLVRRERLSSKSMVIEIASNDGYLLQYFKSRGVRVLGVEPARNVARAAELERGIPTRAEFFTEAFATELIGEGLSADVVVGNNVLAHVPDLQGFVRGVRTLLKPGGVGVFEVPYVRDMLDALEFDTIYHEHQCYFSLTSLRRLFARNGLAVFDVEHLPIHGGSLRIFAALPGSREMTERTRNVLAAERAWGVSTDVPYAAFNGRVDELRGDLLDLLRALKGAGAQIAAYGAAAKGVTLLSYCGIGGAELEFVVDRSLHKQGKCFPVDGLPILAPHALVERRPEYALLLTWNFADEILKQQAEYLAGGGRFIIPVPRPRVVGRD